MTRKLISLLPLLLSACYPYTPPALGPATQPAPGAPIVTAAPIEQRAPVTVLLSIDGFRPDYLRQGDTPTLDRLADEGVAARMRPSFPTMTFPNHYTLVTGLRPSRHGVIGNTMLDPARPGVRFKLSDAEQVRDPFWWDLAEPLWVTAERAGIRTGTMFWPGSETAIRGGRPSVYVPYLASITTAQRVDFVLDWLRRPAAERPRLLTLYFDTVDKTSHNAGFASAEKTAAIRESDDGVARLVAGLAALGQPANLVIVSDHGMAGVPPANLIDVADLTRDPAMTVLPEGPQLSLFATPGSEAAVAARVARGFPHASCWAKGRAPAALHYAPLPRTPDWLCVADPYWRFVGEPPKTPYLKGEHGYLPNDPAMASLFIANGPAFAAGRRLPAFDNVDVYPLLRDLIGLPPADGIDGDDRPFRDVLRR